MEGLRTFLIGIEIFFIIYLMCYALILMCSVIVGAISVYDKMRRNKFKNLIRVDEDIRISIIVPAFNEEITILDTIESLAQVDYKSYEIVVVNDGSTDNTLKKVIDFQRPKF